MTEPGSAHRAIAVPRAQARMGYVWVGTLIAAIAVVGFWRTYFGPLLAGNVDVLPLIHFHVAVYVGWLVLVITQAALAAMGRVDLHMSLGRFGIGYGVVVILAGLLVGFGMFVVRVRAGAAPEAIGRLFGPVVDMLIFAPLFAAAIYYRRRPGLHKRLMILATTTLLVAAVGRMRPFLPSFALQQLVWCSPILLMMAYDYAKQRIVHLVYVFGLLLLLAESQPVRMAARTSDAWRSFGAWLAEAVQ
jgi:hypothetical protein